MLIKNCKIILQDSIKLGSVKIEKNIIKKIIFKESFKNAEIHNDNLVIDAKGLYLSPGFIDIHIHGAGGFDIMDGTYESVNGISKTIIKYGTTSFLPTTITSPIDKTAKAISAIKEATINGTDGANIIGVHLEGPFINSNMLGAHVKDYIQAPSVKIFASIIGDNIDLIKSITLAPEIPGSIDIIKYLSTKGIIISLGHSKGTYKEAIEGIKAGISHSTHLYNAMAPYHHRETGVIGAIFDTNISTELICDGIHVSYPAIRIALKQKGTDNTILVSDAIMACDMPNGEYTLGDQSVSVLNHIATLPDGTLAGSTLTLNKSIKNLKENTTYELQDIVKMATYVPAKLLKIDKIKGIIKEGHVADLLLFDENINIKKVILGGSLYYCS